LAAAANHKACRADMLKENKKTSDAPALRAVTASGENRRSPPSASGKKMLAFPRFQVYHIYD
jgi:hypothetical protein